MYLFFLALEDDINTWPCFECSRGFTSSDELQKHLNEHENIAPPNGLLNDKRVKVILPQKDAKARHKCPICPRVFERQYSVQRHIALHKGDKKYKCDECNARYSLRFNLNRHKRRVHSSENSKIGSNHTRCEICGLWFKVTATFRIHCYSHYHPDHSQKVVTSEDDLKCPQCCEKFLNWPDHVAHATTHGDRHILQPLDAQDPVSDQTLTVSNPRTQNGTELRKPHKCEFCYKSFSTEERLTVSFELVCSVDFCRFWQLRRL